MRLIGAKAFLETVKPGTLFIEFWMHSEKECLEIIKDYKSGVDITQKYYGEALIFGDNSGSLGFVELEDEYDYDIIDGVKYTCLNYYDHNIVGDALPTNTLYLVFDSEDEWPEKIAIVGNDDKRLNREDMTRIREWFFDNCGPFCDETGESVWALQRLKTDKYYKDSYIVNYNGE